MKECLYCHDSYVTKNGKLPSGGQRWKCHTCSKQFSTGGARATYGPRFKQQVIDQYCHHHRSAKHMIATYAISSRTLVKRKKEHVQQCRRCLA